MKRTKLLFLTVLSLCFASCGSDDDDDIIIKDKYEYKDVSYEAGSFQYSTSEVSKITNKTDHFATIEIKRGEYVKVIYEKNETNKQRCDTMYVYYQKEDNKSLILRQAPNPNIK